VTNYAQRGRSRERKTAERLRDEGWVVLKGTSFGICDLAAMRDGDTPMLVEVKSTVRPYHTFSPGERETLLLEAARAGARAVLAHWPPRGQLRFIPSTEWPT
jgi:Holliday junction resolvase